MIIWHHLILRDVCGKRWRLHPNMQVVLYMFPSSNSIFDKVPLWRGCPQRQSPTSAFIANKSHDCLSHPNACAYTCVYWDMHISYIHTIHIQSYIYIFKLYTRTMFLTYIFFLIDIIYIYTPPGQKCFLLTSCCNPLPLDSWQVSCESHGGSRISWFAFKRTNFFRLEIRSATRATRDEDNWSAAEDHDVYKTLNGKKLSSSWWAFSTKQLCFVHDHFQLERIETSWACSASHSASTCRALHWPACARFQVFSSRHCRGCKITWAFSTQQICFFMNIFNQKDLCPHEHVQPHTVLPLVVL